MKVLKIILLLLIASNTIGAPGDTLRVDSHDETHWSWNGQYQDTVQFPSSGEYQKIRMHYVMGCPTGGCSEWDYKTNIEIWQPDGNNNMDKYEIARVITPYAGNRDSSWKHEYIIDVTDYAPLLKGEQIVNAYYGGYQDGFTITVWFEFIEGTPPREVLSVDKVYRSGAGGFVYGISSDPIENHLNKKTMNLISNTESAKFRLVATGHGFGNDGGNPENCAEFCAKEFTLEVNNQPQFTNLVWKDDCGSEPYYGQTGTWVYNRAGWCPGSQAQIFDHELKPFLSGNTVALDVDWENYTYTSGSSFDPHYWIEAQLFQYGPSAYEVDADLDMILTPSTYDRESRYNPSCGSAMIRVKNQGSSSINSMKIEYNYSPGGMKEYDWTGDLKPYETVDIELPIQDEYIYSKSNQNIFTAEITQVNGQSDENSTNNSNHSYFEDVNVMPSTFISKLKTNNNGQDTRMSLVRISTGDTILNYNNLSSNTEYFDTLNLDGGCYKLHVSDAAGDGLQWWANQNQGSGYLQLTNLGLPDQDTVFIEPLPTDFGNFYTYFFSVDYPVGGIGSVPDNVDDVVVYPNPTTDNLSVEVSTVKKGEYVLEIFSTTGAKVLEDKFSVSFITKKNYSLNGLDSGVYLMKIKGPESNHTKRIIKN
jgi:hypothetical protein